MDDLQRLQFAKAATGSLHTNNITYLGILQDVATATATDHIQ